MLSGASRICCVGLVVMAPALRKADNAKGYHFPLVEALDITHSFDLTNSKKQLSDSSEFLDFIHLYSSSLLNTPHCDAQLGKNSRYKFWVSTARVPSSWLPDLKHFDVKGNIDRHEKRQLCVRDGVDVSAITSYHTMNRDIPPVQDGMGLLNTNTTLDCDFKAHCNIGHQSAFTTVEQELLVMSPKELEDPSDFSIFEVSSDNMEHPLTPPASRPGSVPVIAASSKALPSASVVSLKNIDFDNRLRTKAENLMRRLHKLQTHHAELHIVQQLKSFVPHQQRNLGILCQRPPHNVTNRRTKDSMNIKTEFFHSDVKNLSTAALVKLVRRLESSHVSSKLPHMQRGMWVDAGGCLTDGNTTKLNSSECIETKRVAGTLMTNLRHLESYIDSDATESSSGGESCDEYDMQVNKKVSTVNIRRRAEWKWAVDRASVAARWTWLQAQISDLEYSIRQQNDIHCQLRLSKQPLTFGCQARDDLTDNFSSVDCMSSIRAHSVDNSSEATICLSGTSKEIRSLSLANKHLTKPVNGLLDSGTNGYHPVRGVLSNSNSGQCVDHSIKHLSSSSSNTVCCSSRTRPLNNFKKRKLFRTIGLHLLNKKVAQLSTVKCSCNCQCKMLPCILCGGRYNNIQTVDQDVMPVIERISLLDPSFHPVISFEHEISYDLVVQKLLKYTEISKSLSQWGLHLKKKLQMSGPTKGLRNHSRKSTCRLARNAAQTLLCSAKLRKNFGGKKPGPKKKLVRAGKRKYVRKKQLDINMSLVKKRPYRRRTLSVASSGSSKPDSPVLSPSYWNTEGLGGNSLNSNSRPSILHDMLRRRRGENTFDINNIVIPYSVASSTRVEKIKYKEIVTPKWRLIEDALPLDAKEDAMPEENEDISDEIYSERHGLCEREEKKKFSTIYKHTHPHGRIRSRSRGDIHADSSDGNTPDTLSPHHFDVLGQDSNSSLNITDCLQTHTSPMSMFLEDSLSSIVTAYPSTERRRTASFTKKDWPDESRIDVEELEEVAPYEPYVFPLSDEVYERMLENSPHLRVDSSPLSLGDTPHSYSNSPVSPESSSNSSIIDDDPCDPEWTVVSERGSHQSLVLKFAKR